jgi:nitroimidazol reductase NimA-like FMN-containing flavoprotein (pyridoxamine 5'-phosphate oxidase superfamily)
MRLMKQYHQRRPAQIIDDPVEQREIIDACVHLTFAMAVGDEPYLATVNYGYDETQRCFFFHCHPGGKKVRMLQKQPVVWGQILDDRGYMAARCLHDFRTVQLRGRVTFLDDDDQKRQALFLMIDQLEPDPEAAKARFVDDASLGKVAIGRLDVEGFTAKRGKTD